MTSDPWLTETYFAWLADDCFSDASERRNYEGVLRILHDIPFYWLIWSDENRAGDALAFRQSDFLGSQSGLEQMDQHWLHSWGMAAPSVLEVLLGMSRRYTFYFEGPVQMYFQHMFRNLGLDRYPGRMLTGQGQENVRRICDDWMSRQFNADGSGSPFPIRARELLGNDFRTVDIWGQMNAYSAEHFQ